MAKRELSNTLRNLKFMQRNAPKAEEKKVVEEEVNVVVESDAGFGPSPGVKGKCTVIMEGNPHPGAVRGRMSFRNFNPSIDKLNQEAVDSCITQTTVPSTDNQNCETSGRQTSVRSVDRSVDSNNDMDIDIKRKKPDMKADLQSPDNPQHSRKELGEHLSPENSRKASKRQRKREKLDWNLLRREKVDAQSD